MNETTKRTATLALFLLVSVGGGLVIGIANPPGDWYASLAKPWFTPPGALFPVAWTVLYILIGIAGWRVYDRDLGRPTWRWIQQMALNFSWSPVFFGAHLIGWGLVVILLLLGAVLFFIAETWRSDRTAALCFVPYAAWVAFASLLNGSIWLLN